MPKLNVFKIYLAFWAHNLSAGYAMEQSLWPITWQHWEDSICSLGSREYETNLLIGKLKAPFARTYTGRSKSRCHK